MENSVLMVIDVQQKIFATMHEQVETERNIVRLIAGAKVFHMPVIWTEQYPKGLGRTIRSVREALEGRKPLEKTAFSCCGDKEIESTIESQARKQILLCGIEAHVCVYQTAVDLLEKGFEVHLVSDAVMSRHELNYRLALQKVHDLGANLTSVEMALFELQRIARGETFKSIAQIIK
ncbi:MAG: hydrolase [Candidatus Neomarinimicrobiota bacterium]